MQTRTTECLQPERLPVFQLSDGDAELLVRALMADEDSPSVREVLRGIASGYYQLWRVPGGIFITQIVQTRHGRKLYVSWAAGKDMIPRWREVKAALLDIARRMNCTRAGFCAKNPALGRVYERIGAVEITREFELEV